MTQWCNEWNILHHHTFRRVILSHITLNHVFTREAEIFLLRPAISSCKLVTAMMLDVTIKTHWTMQFEIHARVCHWWRRWFRDEFERVMWSPSQVDGPSNHIFSTHYGRWFGQQQPFGDGFPSLHKFPMAIRILRIIMVIKSCLTGCLKRRKYDASIMQPAIP